MTTWQSLNEEKTKTSNSQNDERGELLSDEMISKVQFLVLVSNVLFWFL